VVNGFVRVGVVNGLTAPAAGLAANGATAARLAVNGSIVTSLLVNGTGLLQMRLCVLVRVVLTLVYYLRMFGS
jgi:hypothetical protein